MKNNKNITKKQPEKITEIPKINRLQHLKETFLFLFGLSFCMFIFYVRVILVRVPHEIIFSWNIYWFSWCFVLLLVYVYMLNRSYHHLSEIKNKNTVGPKINEPTKLQKFIQFIKEMFDEALRLVLIKCVDNPKIIRNFVYTYFYKSIFIIHDFLCAPPRPIFGKRYFWGILHLCFLLLPRLIVTIAFLCDVIFFNYFYYLYKVLLLLLIQIFWRIFIYILKFRVNHHQKIISIFFEIEEITDPIRLKHEFDTTTPLTYYKKRKLTKQVLTTFKFNKTFEEYDKLMKESRALEFVEKNFLAILEGATSSPVYFALTIFLYYMLAWIWLYMAFKLFCDLLNMF